jgi:Flp pilus assembly protein TadG
VIEVALMAPWIFFLFVGVFDFGFYAYALISVENAARVAAMYTSSATAAADDSSTACQYALEELRALPNVRSLPTCGAVAAGTPVTNGPMVVRAQAVTGADGESASTVSVTYQTVPMIPIPGLVAGQLTVTRTVQMRVRV